MTVTNGARPPVIGPGPTGRVAKRNRTKRRRSYTVLDGQNRTLVQFVPLPLAEELVWGTGRRPAWTQDLPASPGHYWFDQVLDPDAYPNYGRGVCEVFQGRYGLEVSFPHDDHPARLECVNAPLFWWCGPIQRPERT